ncbi:hypothetical protein [Sediminicola sp. YIK13]|uniref:hypothetical protein n=1 Tax=Sediminicola sp. YIK13 TaxID=1453352 RepID=UPI00119D4DDA|nr:hypothetical protein [Sediminicola sp. YIK13]
MNREFGSETNGLAQDKDHLTKANKIGIATILLILPVLFYSYKLASNDIVEVQIFGICYNSGFPTFQTFLYFVCVKMFSFIYLFIWFLTCKHLWRYGVLINLLIVVFQMFSIVNPSISQAVDEHELYYSLPFIVPILLMLFLLVNVFSYQMQIREADRQLEHEITRIIVKHQSSDINEKFAIPFQQLSQEKKIFATKRI